MNIYKITYAIGSEDSGTDTTEIIERSEAATRKRFKVFSKAGTITAVELIRENVSATKEQERETLEKIKAMVAELGPNSYVATAFEGCFEIAEQNIEYDAADSPKERNELVDKENRELREKLREKESAYNGARSEAGHLRTALDAAREELEALRGKQLPAWLHSVAYSLASEELTAARQRMEQSAETMAQLADAPQDIAFTAAVQNYRAAKERRGVCERIIAGLEDLTEK